ncbi:hypothetical protein FK521_29460, partial [Klebsiella pneumoniae]|nr:hypothetical protein [Klebsiella pneumoniae]
MTSLFARGERKDHHDVLACCSVAIGVGPTVLQMVPLLSHFNNITVMTNSLHIVNVIVPVAVEQRAVRHPHR